MERKRVKGRFVREDGGTGAKGTASAVRAPRPSQCRSFALKRIAEAMPELIATLIEKAKGGSYPHMAILVRMAELHTREAGTGKKKTKRRGSNLMAKLVREMLEGKTARQTAQENAESVLPSEKQAGPIVSRTEAEEREVPGRV